MKGAAEADVEKETVNEGVTQREENQTQSVWQWRKLQVEEENEMLSHGLGSCAVQVGIGCWKQRKKLVGEVDELKQTQWVIQIRKRIERSIDILGLSLDEGTWFERTGF